MSDWPAHLALLAGIDHVSVDVAMAESLDHADKVTASQVTRLLLERGKVSGYVGVIRRFDKLPAEAQQLVLDQMSHLDEAMRHAAESDDVQARLNVIDMIHRTVATRLAWLLSRQLHESDSRLNKAAAMALLRLSRHQLVASNGPAGLTPVTLAAQHHLVNALAEACACFHQHRRRDVLMALLCFAPYFPAGLYRYLTDHKSPAFNPLGELVAQADHPITCRALLGLATLEPMQPFVIRALGQPEVGRQLAFVLRGGPLLIDPVVRTTIRKVRRTDHLFPDRSSLANMDVATQRQLAQWIDALPVPANLPNRRVAALADLAASHDRLTRLMALRVLMRQSEIEQMRADDVIASMCFDSEPAIARLALRHLLRTRWSGLGELMIRLIGSDHEAVRALAERHIGPVGFEKYWSNWPNMTHTTRQAAGRALMKLDEKFLTKMAHRMVDEASENRLQAVQIIRQLGQETYFERQLLTMASDGDARVASAAVRAMSMLHDSPGAVAAVSGALTHQDDRVRANAIESLESMHRVGHVQETLMDLAAGRGNRSRANAIKALMGLPMGEAVPALLRMLADVDDRHRISALWVVERMNLIPLVEQVALLARKDGDSKVRRRAVRVVQDLAKTAMKDSRQAG
ncbi:MAG: HEAT repeat domain-containing protein [Phycisphaerales bacterium]